MIIFYSGSGDNANPEITLGNDANLMLTFAEFCYDKKHGRSKKLHKARCDLEVIQKPRTSRKPYKGEE